MLVLVTISDMRRLALVLDVASGDVQALPVRPEFIDPTVRGRVPCRPFGITWSRDELFVANNRQLLVFNKTLGYLRTHATALHTNTHQLAYHDSRVWAVSPWTNSLIGIHPGPDPAAVELDLLNHRLDAYVLRDQTEADDRHHFNSLLWSGGYLFVSAHNFKAPSFIARYDSRTLKLESVMRDVGSAVHGLALVRDELFWLSTDTRELCSNRGLRMPLSREGYARGFAVTGDHFVVAISQFLGRDKRHGGDSWIQIIERQRSKLLREIHLDDTGSINDLRVLDEYDHAHAVEPFLSREHRHEAAASVRPDR